VFYGHEYFVNPRLKLTIEEKAKIQYKILGQVANPGFYEVPPNLNINLLDAIAIAGGYTRLAGKITLRKPERTGPDKITSFRVKKLAKANSTSIPSISGGESIVVGETFF
jgi:polysaccharide export outer membrane protein